MLVQRLQSDSIKHAFDKKKAVTIMGPRQVGKSTLIKELFSDCHDALWLNGDLADHRMLFDDFSDTKMKLLLDGKTTLIIDEAQRIQNIGLYIKIIVDNLPKVKVIATGSSSFELAATINESLAGRKREFKLLPLSFVEMAKATDLIQEKRMLDHRMRYGYYPEVVTEMGEEQEILRDLADSYLYKDILALGAVKKPDSLVKLVKALSYQIGNLVSYNELSQLVGLDVKTISRYIDVLEKCYILYSMASFSRNQRNELKNSKKIYFWDLGIRNAVIGNFIPLDKRSPEERGALWENFIITERLKKNNIDRFYGSSWFWRTTAQTEIDYIEEQDGKLTTFEFKYNPKVSASQPVAFRNSYPDTPFKVINPMNIEEFLLM